MTSRTFVVALLGCGSLFCGAMAWSLSHASSASSTHAYSYHGSMSAAAPRRA